MSLAPPGRNAAETADSNLPFTAATSVPGCKIGRVSLADLYAWMRPGVEPPPEAVFLRAIDLLLNDLMPDAERGAARCRTSYRTQSLRRGGCRGRQITQPRLAVLLESDMLTLCYSPPEQPLSVFLLHLPG